MNLLQGCAQAKHLLGFVSLIVFLILRLLLQFTLVHFELLFEFDGLLYFYIIQVVLPEEGSHLFMKIGVIRGCLCKVFIYLVLSCQEVEVVRCLKIVFMSRYSLCYNLIIRAHLGFNFSTPARKSRDIYVRLFLLIVVICLLRLHLVKKSLQLVKLFGLDFKVCIFLR